METSFSHTGVPFAVRLTQIEKALRDNHLLTSNLEVVEKHGIKWVWIKLVNTLLSIFSPIIKNDPWSAFRIDAVAKGLSFFVNSHKETMTVFDTEKVNNIYHLLRIKASHATGQKANFYMNALKIIPASTVSIEGNAQIKKFMDPALEKRVQNAISSFANNLFNQIVLDKMPGESFAISPVSIIAALGMCLHMIKQEYKPQFIEKIGLHGLNEEQVHEAISTSLQNLAFPKGFNQGTMEIAQGIAHKNVFAPHESLIKRVKETYCGEIIVSHNLKDEVNRWVSNKTHGKITTLLDDNTVDFVLLNAVYLEFQWKEKFVKPNEGWEIKDFACADGAKYPVSMMTKTSDYPIYANEAFQMIEMPYLSPKGRKLSQVIFLPKDPEKLCDLEKVLTPENIANYRQQAIASNIQLSLPKTKSECTLSLLDTLKQMGLPLDMIDQSILPGEMKITEVIHKTFVSNDEKGTEAAAVTGIMAKECCALPTEFCIDHSYAYLIMDGDTVLFRGRVSGEEDLVVDKRK